MAGARGLLAQRDGLFVYVEDPDADPLTLIDITTGAVIGTAGSREVTQLRPNRGVQGVIAATLVQFQLSSDDPAVRLAALDAIEDDPEESHLAVLEEFIANETDLDVLERAELLLPALVIAFSDEDAPRVEAIRSLAGNVSLDRARHAEPASGDTNRIRRGAARGRQYRAGTGAREAMC
jgi:urea transport system permease protein